MDNRDIALKAWEMYQGLAKGMGESAWKIRSICFALSAGVISYGYTSGDKELFLVSSFFSVIFMMLESGFRRLQDQYIEKSNDIEITINDYIAGEEFPRFPNSIGTDVDTPQFQDFCKLFHLKRFMFWLPYLLLFLVPILLYNN